MFDKEEFGKYMELNPPRAYLSCALCPLRACSSISARVGAQCQGGQFYHFSRAVEFNPVCEAGHFVPATLNLSGRVTGPAAIWDEEFLLRQVLREILHRHSCRSEGFWHRPWLDTTQSRLDSAIGYCSASGFDVRFDLAPLHPC